MPLQGNRRRNDFDREPEACDVADRLAQRCPQSVPRAVPVRNVFLRVGVVRIQLDPEVAERAREDAEAVGVLFQDVAAKGFQHQFGRPAAVEV